MSTYDVGEVKFLCVQACSAQLPAFKGHKLLNKHENICIKTVTASLAQETGHYNRKYKVQIIHLQALTMLVLMSTPRNVSFIS